ncbi:MAG: hypothetical protein IT366_01690 [Candidatus Hydrogenedentes bacterium]|nr:hypothetical protein [Candidatus Hydrogenedentota bacterium]
MKQFLPFAVAGFILAAGCNQGTPGGPGAVPPRTEESEVTTTTNDGMTKTTVTKETEVQDADEHTFTLDVPNTETDLKPGESKQIAIGVDRGDKMEGQDISLTFSNLPAGISVEPANPTVKAGEDEAPVMIVARGDATPGDFTVQVQGNGTSGPPATNEFKVSVNDM